MEIYFKDKKTLSDPQELSAPLNDGMETPKKKQGHNLQSHSSRCPEEDITVGNRSPQTRLTEDVWSEEGNNLACVVAVSGMPLVVLQKSQLIYNSIRNKLSKSQ